jgi:tetratricopeptide (TPR) repeat protein
MAQRSRVAIVALGTGLALSLSRPAAAQDTTRADETFHAGRELMKDGKLAEACPKFEESQRADPASGTLLALAYCQELSGLLASAQSNYLAAADLAAKEGQTDRQKAAADRARGLEKRVSTLTILVPPELSRQAGLKVKRDGIELDRTAYNVTIPLNGGTHAIEVTAPGRERWAGVVTLQTEADSKTLQLPLLEAEGATAFELTPQRRPGVPLSAPPIESPAVRHMRQASVGLGLASVVGIGIGVTFGLAAKSRNDASNRDGHCDNTGCDAYGAERREAALDAARIATWSFVAAGALGASAIILHFKADNAASTQLATSLLGGSPHVTLSRSF